MKIHTTIRQRHFFAIYSVEQEMKRQERQRRREKVYDKKEEKRQLARSFSSLHRYTFPTHSHNSLALNPHNTKQTEKAKRAAIVVSTPTPLLPLKMWKKVVVEAAQVSDS